MRNLYPKSSKSYNSVDDFTFIEFYLTFNVVTRAKLKWECTLNGNDLINHAKIIKVGNSKKS